MFAACLHEGELLSTWYLVVAKTLCQLNCELGSGEKVSLVGASAIHLWAPPCARTVDNFLLRYGDFLIARSQRSISIRKSDAGGHWSSSPENWEVDDRERWRERAGRSQCFIARLSIWVTPSVQMSTCQRVTLDLLIGDDMIRSLPGELCSTIFPPSLSFC